MRITQRLFVLAVLVPAGLAAAQPIVAGYDVRHNYAFFTPGTLPISFFSHTESASAFEPAPGWDARSNTANVAFIGPVVFNSTVSAGTDRLAPGFVDAGATAGVSANVSAWGGGVWTASMRSFGNAHARFAPPNQAFASSNLSTTIVAGWDWRTGRINWRPVVVDNVGGNASARRLRNRDPIDFRIFNLSDDLILGGSFFDVWTELSVDSTWDDTGLHIPAPSGPLDLDIRIAMPPTPFTSSSGDLRFTIADGVVTRSTATGFFSGYGLPALGTHILGGLEVPNFSNNFDFDYNFSALPGARIEFVLDGGGAGEIPTPGATALVSLAAVLGLRRRSRP